MTRADSLSTENDLTVRGADLKATGRATDRSAPECRWRPEPARLALRARMQHENREGTETLGQRRLAHVSAHEILDLV